MTITQRKRPLLPDEIQAVSEPGLQIHCDACTRDLTHSIRIKCADPVCEDSDDGVDICPSCFCTGKEFKSHKRGHAYRVVELHSYPIFVEDWGADEELLLIEGISLQGLGNWQEIAKHVGTRTKEEVEEHYNQVYINSPNWPLPNMNQNFDVDPSLFHERKRRRISSMSAAVANSKPVPAPTSAPGVHDVSTFLPGRLEFEHELDNDAEDLVKDLEFGVVKDYGGEEMPVDENDVDVVARTKLEEERKRGRERIAALAAVGVDGLALPQSQREDSLDRTDVMTSLINGYDLANGHAEVRREKLAKEDNGGSGGKEKDKDRDKEGDTETEEPVMPPPYETSESVAFKLSVLEMYNHRVEKRLENKAIMFDRGLLDYKKMQIQEKKRPKEEKDIVQRLKPLAKLQTSEDYDAFVDGILWESILRKRIKELQIYRQMGLRTTADIERYEADFAKRTQIKAQFAANSYERLNLRPGKNAEARKAAAAAAAATTENEAPVRPGAPGSGVSTQPATVKKQPSGPLHLSTAPSLHLLTPAEQMLCSKMRIMPRPYLTMKETLVREYARRGGCLRRREAKEIFGKVSGEKTGLVWDFLHQAGYLRAGPIPMLREKEEKETGDVEMMGMETPSSTVNGSMVNGVAPSLTLSSSSATSRDFSVSTPRTSYSALPSTNTSPPTSQLSYPQNASTSVPPTSFTPTPSIAFPTPTPAFAPAPTFPTLSAPSLPINPSPLSNSSAFGSERKGASPMLANAPAVTPSFLPPPPSSVPVGVPSSMMHTWAST